MKEVHETGELTSCFCFRIGFVSEETVVPEIELAFAISATGTDAGEAYRLMKDTLKSMIDEYGSKEINYSVIVYGSSVEQKITFDQTFSDDEALKESLDRMGRATGVPALVETLEEAKKVFEGSNLRGSSIKVCSEIVAYLWVLTWTPGLVYSHCPLGGHLPLKKMGAKCFRLCCG